MPNHQPAVLPPLRPIGGVAVPQKKLLNGSILLPMMLFGSAGVILGRLAATWMGTQWVKWCFGAILIPLGLKELFHKKQSQEKGKK